MFLRFFVKNLLLRIMDQLKRKSPDKIMNFMFFTLTFMGNFFLILAKSVMKVVEKNKRQLLQTDPTSKMLQLTPIHVDALYEHFKQNTNKLVLESRPRG